MKAFRIVTGSDPGKGGARVYDENGKEVQNVLSVNIDPITPDSPITANIKVLADLDMTVYDRSSVMLAGTDIVYFVKKSIFNEELKYSLRSVEKFLPKCKVIFAGGMPKGLVPDRHLSLYQGNRSTKWDNVSRMIIQICQDNTISKKFFLFNDDFYFLKPLTDWEYNFYDGTLEELIPRIQENNNGVASRYIERLKVAKRALEDKGYGTRNFELHLPMKIDREKMLEVVKEFGADVPCKRSLYGNKYFDEEGGKEMADNKIYDGLRTLSLDEWFVSTTDESFKRGQIGAQLRDLFKTPSRYEKEYQR